MPILAPLAPAAATVGGGTTAAGGGTALLGGITATQVITAGAVIASAVTVGVLVDDYLDAPVGDREAEKIKEQAGDKSKADRRALDDCVDCVWCQINIQAQGTLIFGNERRPSKQGIGPYLVKGRTVTAREGVVVAGLTHEWVKDRAPGKGFKTIEQLGVLAATINYIQRQPPSGLAPGMDDYRPGSVNRYAGRVRYDIGVAGTINAFME